MSSFTACRSSAGLPGKSSAPLADSLKIHFNRRKLFFARTSKHIYYSWVSQGAGSVRACLVVPAALLIPARAAGFAFTRSRSILLRVSPERSRARFFIFPLRGCCASLVLFIAAGRACLCVRVALGALLCASDPPLLRFICGGVYALAFHYIIMSSKTTHKKVCRSDFYSGADGVEAGRCLVSFRPIRYGF